MVGVADDDAAIDGDDVAPVALVATGGDVVDAVLRAVGLLPGVRLGGAVTTTGNGVAGLGRGQTPAGDACGGELLLWLWYRKPSASPSPNVAFDAPWDEYAHAPPEPLLNIAQNFPSWKQLLYPAGSLSTWQTASPFPPNGCVLYSMPLRWSSSSPVIWAPEKATQRFTMLPLPCSTTRAA
jgi:hypothetical protein